MSEEINAYCDICGRGYHICRSCRDITSFTPWRVITDTREHYKIFLVLSEYNQTKDKNIAKDALLTCDLSELESFNDNIKRAIKEIMADEKAEDKPKSATHTASRRATKKTVVKSVKTDKEKIEE